MLGLGMVFAAVVLRVNAAGHVRDDRRTVGGRVPLHDSQDGTMTRKAWICTLSSNHALFDKPGVRGKLHGKDWDPARFEQDAPDDQLWSVLTKYMRGLPLTRDELPEAAAVWNERQFAKTKSIFAIAGFYVVRGRLSETLSRFDLGEGGLVPFPMYKADLTTRYPGEFFLLNFGAPKDSFLPEQSKSVTKAVVDHETKRQIWRVNAWAENGDVALSSAASRGTDLWHEESVDNKIFFSEGLAAAIMEIGMAQDFDLKSCRVLEDAR